MKPQKLTMFYLPGCPYCRQAEQFERELLERKPEYRAVEVERIDESKQSALADTYDYYYVPAYFLGKERLFSGAPTEADVERVFSRAREAEE